MKQLYLVTGAAGHLGNTVIKLLVQAGQSVRALVLPQDAHAKQLPQAVEICTGDVRDKESLRAFFTVPEGTRCIVIHCAGIVSIASRYVQTVHDVNVCGTRNIVDLCTVHGVEKLVHVSSVHAIPEKAMGEEIAETNDFRAEAVEGLYAKTKAEATAIVLDAAARGLNACVVHPSGICGPYDYGAGHLTQLLRDYCEGRLKAGVNGGYDFVDVRDVAHGILGACEHGRAGECYILSGHYASIPTVLDTFHRITGRRRVKTILPLWFARLTSPLAEAFYRMLRQPPLYTRYSLYTLMSNAQFSHAKATAELGYTTLPFEDTVADAYSWMMENGRILQTKSAVKAQKKASAHLNPNRKFT